MVGWIAVGAPALAQDQTEIERAIKTCIDLVHRLAPSDYQGQYYKEFDAFYNPATKTVQNNAHRNGDVPAHYEFSKCMAGQGHALAPTN